MSEQESHNTYELTLLIKPDLTEFDLQKVIDKIKTTISAQKGKIIKESSWDKKQLAYPINKIEFGYYYTLVFTFPSEIVNDLIKELQATPNILRHLLISLNKEGISIDQLFSPEKEEAMISSIVKEKLIPKKEIPSEIKSKTKTVSQESITPKKPVVDEKARRKEIDQKIDELLKKDIE